MPTWPLNPDPAAETTTDTGLVALGQPSFFGFGLLTPFRRDLKSDFATGEIVELVKSNIRQVLGTHARNVNGGGEIPWRTDFGSWLHMIRHRDLTYATQEVARVYVSDALAAWEPRARVANNGVRLTLLKRTLHIAVKFHVVVRSTVIARDQDVTLPLLSLGG